MTYCQNAMPVELMPKPPYSTGVGSTDCSRLEPAKAKELVSFLQNGLPPIYTRGHLLNLGIVAFDPRPLADGDVEIIIRRVGDYFASR